MSHNYPKKKGREKGRIQIEEAEFQREAEKEYFERFASTSSSSDDEDAEFDDLHILNSTVKARDEGKEEENERKKYDPSRFGNSAAAYYEGKGGAGVGEQAEELQKQQKNALSLEDIGMPLAITKDAYQKGKQEVEVLVDTVEKEKDVEAMLEDEPEFLDLIASFKRKIGHLKKKILPALHRYFFFVFVRFFLK